LKLGFFTSCFSGLSLEEIADFAADEGFQTLEVACWPSGESDRAYAGVSHIPVADLDQPHAVRIRKLMESRNLSISALGYYPNPLDPNPERRQRYLEHLRQVIRAAGLLGVELVGTFVGRNPEKKVEEHWDNYLATFNNLLAAAREANVRLMIENCPMMHQWPWGTNLAYSPPIWEEMFNLIPDADFGLNYDPSHLFWQGIDYITPLKEFADRIFHVHAKDTQILKDRLRSEGIYGKGWWRYRVPGQGDINWGRFIASLAEAGYDGAISIELEDPVWEGSVDKVKRGLRLGRRHLAQFLA